MLHDHQREPLGSAFTVGQGYAAGWTRQELNGAVFERPFHGVRAIRSMDASSESGEQSHLRRIAAYATVMSAEEFISHCSAAVAWGLPLPPGAMRNAIDVSVTLPSRSPRGRGVNGHAVAGHLVEVVRHPVLQLPIASPASTWAMLSSTLRHPYDLIAVADAAVRAPQHREDPPALAGIDDLAAVVAAGRRVGVGVLRDCLLRVREGSSSRPETWLRLTLVDAGLPEPVLAHEVYGRDGLLIGRVDMAYPPLKIAIEYEGEQHRTDPVQWSKDILRYERLAAEGWAVVRVTKDQLFQHPQSVVVRVRRALTAAF